MDRSDMLVYMGQNVKALGDGRVGGYLVRFTSPTDPDLDGAFFTPDTDFDIEDGAVRTVYYHHGFDGALGNRKLGKATLKFDDVGIWAEAQLALRDDYEKMVYELAQQGKLGWSSGAVGHLVDGESMGKAYWLKTWPIGEASLTPTPAEPRNEALPIKSLVNEATEDDPQAEVQAVEAETEATEAPAVVVETRNEEPTEEIKTMLENETQNAPAAYTQEQVDAIAVKAAEAAVARLQAEPAKAEGAILAPAVKRVTEMGFSDDRVKSFRYFLRTGDDKPYKANENPLNSSDDAQGAVMVPEEWMGPIFAKRDELSVARAAGCLVLQTSTDKVNLTVENGSHAVFALTADETGYEADEPTFTAKSVDVYKYTKKTIVSEELLADHNTNLDAFLQDSVARAYAATENAFVMTGGGSGAPQGIFVGGTAGLTLDAAATIGVTEIPELLYKLGAPYMVQGETCWFARSATLGVIRGLGAATFRYYAPTPSGSPSSYSNGALGDLEGYPFFVTDAVAAMAGGAKSIVVGNMRYYALVERQGLQVVRLNELYRATGQIGFLFSFREGGIVLQAEAFQYATHPTA